MTVVQTDPGMELYAGDVVPKNVSPMIELGATGLRRTSGYVDEEFLPQLRGRKAVQIFREMSDNDPIVGALLFAVDRLLRQVEWRVEPASSKPDDKQAAEFVEQCMEDMSHTWDELITEVLTMLPFGWSWHEIVYKKRMGPWESNPQKRSKFTDGSAMRPAESRRWCSGSLLGPRRWCCRSRSHCGSASPRPRATPRAVPS